MIELDESVVLPQDLEYARRATEDGDESMKQELHRCTCLDRARIALEQTGQVHCAGVMRDLQEEFNYAGNAIGVDPNRPIRILRDLWILSREARRASKG